MLNLVAMIARWNARHIITSCLLFFGLAGAGQPDFRNPIVLNEDNGLPSNYLSDVLVDQQGFTWVGSGRGVCRFDPLRLAFERFGPGYGVPVKNTNQLYLLKNGEIAIGVRKVFCTLHPDKLRLNVDPPTPYLSHFKVFDREFGQFPGAGEVRLSYRQNFFSFEFSAIGYNLPQPTRGTVEAALRHLRLPASRALEISHRIYTF